MSSDVFTTFVIALAGVGTAGFVGWTVSMIIRLRSDVATLRLHISEHYLKKDDLMGLQRDVRELTHVVFTIAGKLGIAVRKDDGS